MSGRDSDNPGTRSVGGPASLTNAWARALGFKSERKFSKEATRLRKSLTRRRPLAADDWLKVIQATELAFINDSVGVGLEWSIVTGLTDITRPI